jgi:hypothetical protein
VIQTLEDTRASSAVTSTSPVAVATGREMVSVDPTAVAVTTDPPDGMTLSARPDPDVITPSTSASVRNARRRSSRAILFEDPMVRRSDTRARRSRRSTEMGPLLNLGSISFPPLFAAY